MTTRELIRWDLSRDLVRPALEAAAAAEHGRTCGTRHARPPRTAPGPCDCPKGTAALALSYLESGYPTGAEMSAAIGGANWVIARRTPAIVRKYGDSVICLTPKDYEAAQRKAVAARAAAMGVAL